MQVLLVLEGDTDRALEGVGPARAALVEEGGRLGPVHRLGDAGCLGQGLAPQAANQTWYPYRFLEPMARNEPWLSSALQRVGDLVQQVEGAGISAERIVLGGFSQGACLASEFAARNARRYGGLLVFSGGLIGPPGMIVEIACL